MPVWNEGQFRLAVEVNGGGFVESLGSGCVVHLQGQSRLPSKSGRGGRRPASAARPRPGLLAFGEGGNDPR